MQLLPRVEKLDAETVFVEQGSLKLGAVGRYHLHGFIFHREFLHGLTESLRQTTAGIPDRIDQIVEGTRRTRRGQVGAKPAALSLEHMAAGTGRASKKELAAAHRIAGHRDRFVLHTANVSDHLPDFFFGHPDPLLRGTVGRHGRSGNPVADGGEDFLVGVAVFLGRPRQIGTTPAAASAKPMAKSAVRAELILAKLGYRSVARERVLGLSRKRLRCEKRPCNSDGGKTDKGSCGAWGHG